MDRVHERPGRSTLLARGLWILAIALCLLGVGLAVGYGPSTRNSIGPGVVFVPLVLVFGGVGALIATRKADNAIGWIFLAAALCWSVEVFAFGYATRAAALDETGSEIAIFADWLQTWFYVPGIGLAIGPLFLLFPNGRPISRRWVPLVWTAFVAVIAISLAEAFTPLTFDPGSGDTAFLTDNPYALSGSQGLVNLASFVAGLASVVVIVGGIASLIIRLGRARGDEREQIRWLVYAALMVVLLGFGVQVIIADVFHRDPWSDPVIFVTLVALFGSIVFIPIAAGIGILKYHLYDIDVVIKKTVVLTVVTVVLTVLYLGVIALATAGAISRLAVGAILLAVTFRPVRRAARSMADRLVYGKRATAYEVLAAFSDRMVETYSTDDVLPRMSQILREATGAATAVVWLKVGRSLRPAASAGESAPPGELDIVGDAIPDVPGSFAADVRHQGELLGALSVTMPANDELDGAREQVIRDLASQAGLVLRNVRLIEELKASRQRLVSAQDEERRRLERNIHDGAQQQLVALSVKLRLLEQLTGRDADRAKALAAELQEESNAALEDLRDLARGIYPPLLADKGLVAALEAQARKAAVDASLQADGIARFAQDVEATVYFCTLEALNNVAKYAGATHATIRLSNGASELRFEVADDGRGFDPAATGYGTGLQGMADRLAALGGELTVESAPGVGTTVCGRLPAEATT